MFIEYSPELLDREGMPLAGVPRANDELGFHPVDMGAPVLHDTVIAGLDLLPGKHGDDGVPFDPGASGMVTRVWRTGLSAAIPSTLEGIRSRMVAGSLSWFVNWVSRWGFKVTMLMGMLTIVLTKLRTQSFVR